MRNIAMCFLSCFMTHPNILPASSQAASLWRLFDFLSTPWGAGCTSKKKNKNSLQVRNKFIVFNLLSSPLYAKCMRYDTTHTHTHTKVLLSLAIHFICYTQYFLSHLLARIAAYRLLTYVCVLGSFNYGLLLSLIAL